MLDPTPPDSRWPQLLRLLVPVVGAAAYAGWMVRSAGRLPDNDYWSILHAMSEQDGSLSRVFVVANEHLVAGAALVFKWNLALFAGSNRSLAALTWLAVVLQTIALLTIVPPELRRSRRWELCAAFAIAGFLLTPSAHFNWFQGQSGVEWGGAQALAVIALVLVEHGLRGYRPRLLASISAVLLLLAALTYSVAYFILPPLLLAVCLSPGGRTSRSILIGLSVVIALIGAMVFEPQPHHPAALSGTVLQQILFPLAYLGAVFTEGYSRPVLSLAALLGGLGLVSVVVCTEMLRRRGRLMAARPWLVLVGFAVGNAVATMVFRVGLGVGMGASSRYHFVAGAFWASVIVLVGLCATGQPGSVHTEPKRRRWLPLLVLLLPCIPYATSRGAVLEGIEREACKAEVGSDLLAGTASDELLRRCVTSRPDLLRDLLPRLERMGHVPFD